MFRELRRIEKKASDEVIENILKNGEYGILASIGENEYPYALPISFAYHQGYIYLHGALEGHKIDNIKYNNKVSFCVVGKTNLLPGRFTTEYESVILFGRADFPAGEEKKEGLKALINKYSKGFMEKGSKYIEDAFDETVIIRIQVEHISGKENWK